MMPNRFAMLLVAVLATFAAAPALTAAQEDAVTGCQMTPLALPLFGGTPVAALATPDAVASPAANGLTEEDAERVLEQYVACTNTGDPTLVWAMFSPRWFSATFADPEEHYLPAFEWNLDDPAETAEHPLQLAEMRGIEPLADGRFEVTATFRSGDQEWTDTLTLVQIDGQWLIDDVRLDTGND